MLIYPHPDSYRLANAIATINGITTNAHQGYTFEAESNGHCFTVKVPVGGVEAGQKFSVPFLPGPNGYSGCAIPRVSVPVGHWKVSWRRDCTK
jgi:hypothetical protein